MENKSAQVNRIVQCAESLESGNINICEFVSFLGKKNSSVLCIPDDKIQIITQAITRIEADNCSKGEKGALLEKITRAIFDNTIFSCVRNCRTSTNEIDLYVQWTEIARLTHLQIAFPYFGDSFLCECKNYGEPVGVTYVGKFCSLLLCSNVSLGVMISWNGVTGRGKWDASKGLIKKFALKENRYIVVLDKNDLKQLSRKETNIFSLIGNKVQALKLDIDYSIYLKSHPAESEFARSGEK